MLVFLCLVKIKEGVMNIIIVGCGKVGYTLVDQLSGESHSLVVIDEKPEQVRKITDTLDAMGVIGNGVSYQTLCEAGIRTADLLIAVTGSDEQNLLCCVLARKNGHCQAIARVRNPLYNPVTDFLKKEFDLAMIINPERAAADEIFHLFRFPTAIKIDYFVNGKVELMHFRIGKNSHLKDQRVLYIKNHLQMNILVGPVKRGEEIHIPNGDFIFRENDVVSFIGTRKEFLCFFEKLHLLSNPVKTAILAGGGKISFYLAKLLLAAGTDTTIIEMNKERCEYLSEVLPKANIIHGDATDEWLLEQEGLGAAQGFAALTDLDEENILLSLHVKKKTDAKVITKVNRVNFASVISGLELDTVMYPRVITSNYIVRYVRVMENSLHKRMSGSDVERLYLLEDGRAEALEFVIREPSGITDVPLCALKIKRNILIGCIYRNGEVILPGGQDTIQVKDSVIVFVSGYKIANIREILEA